MDVVVTNGLRRSGLRRDGGIGAAINTGEVGRGGATHMDNSRETELVGTIQDLTGRC